MSVRAVIFDVYQTLLEVGPAPSDAAARWELLWEDHFADPARLTLEDFDVETKKAIAREHELARRRNVRFPEVNWAAIAREVLPELARVSDTQADDFLFAHAQLVRTVQMSPAVGVILRSLREQAIPLGIASNSQAYTQRELDGALATHRLDRSLLETDLCFWSFERGFSKPDVEVFHWLAAHLQKRGISPGETLMVGDREDNDILPAHQAGWQTWRLHTTDTTAEHSGDWPALKKLLLGH